MSAQWARVLTTSGDRMQSLEASSVRAYGDSTDDAILLRPSDPCQEIDGFGYALTYSSCYNLLRMPEEARDELLTKTFSPTEGHGVSYVRISLGCNDFSSDEYSLCDRHDEGETDPLRHFSLHSDETDYIIPVLKRIIAINPSLKIIAAPWTPPRWMKYHEERGESPDSEGTGDWTGGRLRPKYYGIYGEYFVKFIQTMAANGVRIHAVSPQNEPLNWGNSASLYMEWEEQRDFVKTALGPQMKAAGLSTKIYAFDHNYNYDNIESQKNYPGKIYEDAAASQYLAGAAYHNYGGNREELLNIHQAYPEKELLFTETSIGTWNSGRDLSKRLMEDMEEVALGTINNWCKGVIVWNLMLDNDRGPNREGGCQTCYGAVDINNSDYKTIIRNSHYYIIAHLSSVVKPGAVRIATTGYTDNGITCSAFENTDGTYAFVLINNNEKSKKITVSDGQRHFAYDVPGKSVTSYRWAKSK